MDPSDLVTQNGQSRVSLAELAKQWNTNASGAMKMCRFRGIPTEESDGTTYVRAEHIPSGVVKVKAGKGAGPRPHTPHADAPRTNEPGESRTVELRSGGTVQITVNVSVLNLSPDDRAWLFEIIDRVADYERRT